MILKILRAVKSVLFTAAKVYALSVIALLVIGTFRFHMGGAPLYESGLDFSTLYGLLFFSVMITLSFLIFKVKVLPLVFRYIINFLIIYAGGVLFIVIMGGRVTSQDTIPMLSIAFAVAYLIILAVVLVVRSIISSAKNKKLDYSSQFDNTPKSK